jgi:hypothetical protein
MFSPIQEGFDAVVDFWWPILCGFAAYKVWSTICQTAKFWAPDQHERQYNGKFLTVFQTNSTESEVLVSSIPNKFFSTVGARLDVLGGSKGRFSHFLVFWGACFSCHQPNSWAIVVIFWLGDRYHVDLSSSRSGTTYVHNWFRYSRITGAWARFFDLG